MHEEDTAVAAEGVLLWLLHTLLRSKWRHVEEQLQRQSPACELRYFAGNVSLLPAETYQLNPESAVDVRAIKVQQKLFVHFVSVDATLRLALLVNEYVKPTTGDGDTATDPTGGRVVRVGRWLVNRELLQWRLERNVFPDLSLEPPVLRMGAELSKLAEPVLTRVYAHLRAADFVCVTQTNKYLHRMAANASLWATFLEQDFPAARRSSLAPPVNAKLEYIAKHQEKLQRDRARLAMLRLAMLWDPSRDHHGRGPFVPGQPPLWLPPSPFHQLLPGGGMLDFEGRRGRRRSRPDSDLDFDFELRPAFDRCQGEFDGLL